MTEKFLYSREHKKEDTIIDVNGVKFGSGLVFIAGPCSVEKDSSIIISIAEAVKEKGANMLRGGAFKPRSSPYSFQGLGEEGLKMLSKARDMTGLPIVTEVMDTKDVELVDSYADVIQIGARNMQNFSLLKEVGKLKTPILLKRGLCATLDEFLMSAEYIFKEGNPNVILCERGIRTFVKYTRNTLDLSIIPALKEKTHLPIIVDPSHGTGVRNFVNPMSKAAIAAGADGLIIEVHTSPNNSLSDAGQTIDIDSFFKIVQDCEKIKKAL